MVIVSIGKSNGATSGVPAPHATGLPPFQINVKLVLTFFEPGMAMIRPAHVVQIPLRQEQGTSHSFWSRGICIVRIIRHFMLYPPIFAVNQTMCPLPPLSPSLIKAPSRVSSGESHLGNTYL